MGFENTYFNVITVFNLDRVSDIVQPNAKRYFSDIVQPNAKRYFFVNLSEKGEIVIRVLHSILPGCSKPPENWRNCKIFQKLANCWFYRKQISRYSTKKDRALKFLSQIAHHGR